jgi:hypothetical protein
MKPAKKKSDLFSVHGDKSLTAHLKFVLVDECPVARAVKEEHAFLKKRGWKTEGDPHPEIARVWHRRVRDKPGDKLRKTYGLKGPAYKHEFADKMDREEELAAHVADYAEKSLLAAERGDLKMVLHFAYLTGRHSGIAQAGFRAALRGRANAKRPTKPTVSERIRSAFEVWTKGPRRGAFSASDLCEIDPSFKKTKASSLKTQMSRAGVL